MNNRKAEFIMTIIGASLGALGVLITAPMLLMIMFVATTSSSGMMSSRTMMHGDDLLGLVFGGGLIVISLLLAIVACLFGFIAAFKLKKGNSVKAWSIALIVIGALCFFSYGWITGVLFLISGIMSLTKLSSDRNSFDDF
ncbi:hypothetical protein MFLO_03335 [Listeria floridensis FSL S10-1187]|uniref:DUF4064 domain-containing protein n=1 Tax=Listeria floridensis FSL S10-1187 TaxID=1265817 RepID=A0ABN0RHL5_9LIST|nr:DUF4064 domain-containing protein [Listeria floridensis]EUJ33340.1 hypothetical protein MFLO_03335 [Listeria floridensis FSL S10-1187]